MISTGLRGQTFCNDVLWLMQRPAESLQPLVLQSQQVVMLRHEQPPAQSNQLP